ncbi:hypothetical protein AQUSIP_25870 [Aquicella siphonis]|uniref:N-acetyltransferase domain-containing protein n=1 Tax=Aquicella siphonis TaxID=254247 RepID=A0A5E4PJP1_9COXI|nr:GNAT family N-acetyltransferase [Aquicella siphonis]VVC77260.1 hypothetical protein AQUSIP_25870 [Aquicella siphonis]
MKIIETERLLLRTWEERDIEPMTRIDQDPRVCEFLPGIGSRSATEAAIRRFMQHYHDHGFSLYAVELKSTFSIDPSVHKSTVGTAGNEFIGYIGLLIPSFEAHFTPAVEIGWRLASRHWGQGYATEGAKAVLKYGFDELGLREIVSFTVPANTRSIRVMEKIGMRRDLSGDFRHPRLSLDHPLSLHLLYRIQNDKS